MIEDIISRVEEIFVGRQGELVRLQNLWKLALKPKENKVYVLLNAPGVGKSTLIDHFGRSILSEEKGLFIKLISSSNYNSPKRINLSLIEEVDNALNLNQERIFNYLKKNNQSNEEKRLRTKFENIKEKIDEVIRKKTLSIYNISNILTKLSTVIPFIFAVDEIQELQKISFTYKEGPNTEPETGLHYLARLLKNLLNSRILIILSGTRYHILSQIGGDLGSPIRQKVRPLIIQKFEQNEILAYYKQVRLLIKSELQDPNLNDLLNHYYQFLLAFSGGHPRTFEQITEHFLSSFHHLLSQAPKMEYSDFVDFLLPILKDHIANTLLSSAHKKALLSLDKNEAFSLVKEWILNNASQGLKLGARIQYPETPKIDEEVRKVIYELMNIGIIVQNGNYNYHLTNYFHLLEFLNLYIGPYEQFLREILNNKYFKLMCGFHSGFGYTFENIFTAALLVKSGKFEEINIDFPLKLSRLRNLKTMKGDIDLSTTEILPNVLYQTPAATAIDAYILQGEELFLFQITTATPSNLNKIIQLKNRIVAAQKEISNRREEIKGVQGLYISLFPLENPLPSEYRNKIKLISRERLIQIFGTEIYSKLVKVKESFRN